MAITLEILKFVTVSEEVLVEGFKAVEYPWHLFAVAVVLRNPWAGRFVEDLMIQFAISDAPRDYEIAIALGGASGGRPHHRIGDRYQDLKGLGRDQDNPAAVSADVYELGLGGAKGEFHSGNNQHCRSGFSRD